MTDQRFCARIGVISDTHGLLRPQAVDALCGCELIVHAGDIGKPEVLAALREVVPVIAVRGNVDNGSWASDLPWAQVVSAGPARLYVLHDLSQLGLDPAVAGYSAVISGHSHRPFIRTDNGVLFLNPGAAGPRRFNLPVTVAVIDVNESILTPTLVQLI